MTRAEFAAIQGRLGLSHAQLGRILGRSANTVSRYRTEGPNGLDIPKNVAIVMGWLDGGFRPPEWPDDPRGGRHGRIAEKIVATL